MPLTEYNLEKEKDPSLVFERRLREDALFAVKLVERAQREHDPKIFGEGVKYIFNRIYNCQNLVADSYAPFASVIKKLPNLGRKFGVQIHLPPKKGEVITSLEPYLFSEKNSSQGGDIPPIPKEVQRESVKKETLVTPPLSPYIFDAEFKPHLKRLLLKLREKYRESSKKTPTDPITVEDIKAITETQKKVMIIFDFDEAGKARSFDEEVPERNWSFIVSDYGPGIGFFDMDNPGVNKRGPLILDIKNDNWKNMSFSDWQVAEEESENPKFSSRHNNLVGSWNAHMEREGKKEIRFNEIIQEGLWKVNFFECGLKREHVAEALIRDNVKSILEKLNPWKTRIDHHKNYSVINHPSLSFVTTNKNKQEFVIEVTPKIPRDYLNSKNATIEVQVIPRVYANDLKEIAGRANWIMKQGEYCESLKAYLKWEEGETLELEMNKLSKSIEQKAKEAFTSIDLDTVELVQVHDVWMLKSKALENLELYEDREKNIRVWAKCEVYFDPRLNLSTIKVTYNPEILIENNEYIDDGSGFLKSCSRCLGRGCFRCGFIKEVVSGVGVTNTEMTWKKFDLVLAKKSKKK